jgi:hypothetical protein
MEASVHISSAVYPGGQSRPFNSSGKAEDDFPPGFHSAKRFWKTAKICFIMPEKNMLDNLF